MRHQRTLLAGLCQDQDIDPAGRHLPMHRLPIALVMLILAACGSAATATGTASAGSSTSAEPTSSPSREPTSTVEPSASAEIESTIVGAIGFDDIEGGCTYVQAADGTRYVVTWPDGWSFDAGLNLIDPSGEVVAGIGDEVTLGGRIAGDLASICQIGPVFEAVEVTVGG